MRPDVLTMAGMETGRRPFPFGSRNNTMIAKKSNSFLSTFLDPHPDSPIVLSAQPEAPADADLVQSPEVQVQPDFREPPRCSSRCHGVSRRPVPRCNTQPRGHKGR